MEIEIYPPMPSRPCRFCLTLQGGSVFADFDVDPDGIFAVRVSFDGYGCCHAPAAIGRMGNEDTATLLAMIERGSIEPAAEGILRTYFRANQDALWSDALAHHDLVTHLDDSDRASMLELLRIEGVQCERFVFLLRDELVLDGRELLIGAWAGSPAPHYEHGNVSAIGRDDDAVYWICAPQAPEGRTVRVFKTLHRVRRVSTEDWMAKHALQRPEQREGIDSWFETAKHPPAWNP